MDNRKDLARTLQLKLDYEQLTNCMRCGFCLPACPTFRETGLEAESPRGRIALMKAAVDGLMEPDPAFRDQMNDCLGCRACEPVCPADVKYGQLMEQTRDALEDHAQHRLPISLFRKLIFRSVFPYPRRLRRIGKLLAFYRKSGLRRIARDSGLLKLLPGNVRAMESILPDASGQGVVQRIGVRHPAKGERIARVALFRGCVMDVLFADTNVHTAELLAEAGFEVLIPDDQVCCGALHAHSGEMEMARRLARANVRAFRDLGADYIVTNAGGCGALLIEYGHLLKDDPDWDEQAKWFAERVIDVSRLLVEHGRLPAFAEPASPDPAVVTYQDSCHLRNVMKSGAAPRQLIKRVRNATYREMKEGDRCCGSAGIYNITRPDMAGRLLDRKMDHVAGTEASYLLTSNPGCLLQMKLGADRRGAGDRLQVMHLVDFLYERLERKGPE